MRTITMRKTWVALALVASIIACKGESPTTPSPGPGQNPPPGGGTPPPAGVSVTLTVSNPDPLVDSTVIATATVTNDGQPVPNGTAVEFTATGGSFGVEGQSLIRTTTNGAASITLTSSTAGPVEIRAIVNNVIRSTIVTFRTRPVVEPEPSTQPVIDAISPAIGRPSGGETIVISGRNFRTPVRVLFRADDGTTKEVLVVSASPTEIVVMTPSVNIPVGQQTIADVILIVEAGTANEQRLEQVDAFTFRSEQLTPRIATITPNSGPATGNTRVEIFGDGFQSPVQVLFGTAEARVISVDFARIEVETPAGRDTNPDGSGAVLGPVVVTVRNINSQTSAEMAAGFHYKSAVEVIAVGPTEGPSTGGTTVEITGHGFLAPVAVTIAGVAAQPTFVSGTKIIAITSPVDIEGCGDVSGPVVVTNLANGDSAEGVEFTYDVPKPIIVGVTPASPGGVITVTVVNAGDFSRLAIGDTTLAITGETESGGLTAFTAVVPMTLELATEECADGVEREIPTAFDITYTDLVSDCEDTLTNGVTVAPAENDPVLVVTPATFEPFQATITPASVGPPPTVATVAPSDPQTLTIVNAGTGTLTVSSAALGAEPGCAFFTPPITPSTPASLESCDQFPVTIVYQGTVAGGTHPCTLSVITSEGTRNFSLLGTSQ